MRRSSSNLFGSSRSAKVSSDLEAAPSVKIEEKILEYEYINGDYPNRAIHYNTRTSPEIGSQYLNLKDIKQRAIQVFYTEEVDHNSNDDKVVVPFYHRIVHPYNRFRRSFDFVTVIWVLYLVFIVPFEIGFDWFQMSSAQRMFLDLLDIWFAVDIVLNFRTGYIQHGTIVMDRKKIVKNYLTTWFLVDILGTFPFERIIAGEPKSRKSIKLIKYFKIPKLMRISRVMKYVRDHKYVYDIFQVFVLVFTLLHVGACVWVLVLNPCETDVYGKSIYDSNICDQEQLSAVYAEAFHMSTVMILGISNSHIVSTSTSMDVLVKRKSDDSIVTLYIVSTLYMVCGLFILALLMSETNAYLMGKMQGSAIFQRRSDRVKHEMEYYEVPHDLQLQVRAFYDYVWIHQKQYDDQVALLSDGQMSTDLQRKLALHLFKDVVSHISFFSDVGDILLGEICLSLRTRIFLPKDTILFKGDIGKELFIISKGIVEVLRDDLPPEERKDAQPILLRNGSFFGEIALVMEVRRTCSVRARTICELNLLKQSAFDAILKENPDFARRMNELVVARQLETTLSRSNRSGIDFQVSQEDVDRAVAAVEINMREGLKRRMGRVGSDIPNFSDLASTKDIRNKRSSKRDTHWERSSGCNIQSQGETKFESGIDMESSDDEVSRRSLKANITDIPTMISDIARRSIRFKGDQIHSKNRINLNPASEGSIIFQDESSGNLDVCSDGEVTTTTRKINKQWWKKYRRKKSGRSASVVCLDKKIIMKESKHLFDDHLAKRHKSLKQQSPDYKSASARNESKPFSFNNDEITLLGARLDVQDEMMKKLITKLESFEKITSLQIGKVRNPLDNQKLTQNTSNTLKPPLPG